MVGSANHEDAVMLHTLGYPIIMTGADKNPGSIVGDAWGEYEWDTEKFARLFKKHPNAQIGIKLWPLVDVEIDAPPDDDGSFARKAEALLIELGGDVETPSWTSRRGKHVLFEVTSAQRLALEEAGAPASLHIGNLEVRLGTGKQTQSLIPPSTTDGVARAWINDLLTTDVAPLPNALFTAVHVECLKRQRELQENLARATDAPALERPGDVFNEKVSWEEILEPHGWKARGAEGNVRHWTRPGKSHGVSATTGFCSTDTRPDCFYSFSDAPEIAPLEAQKAYSKFEAYTFLEHDGDFSAATSALVRQGYTPDTGDADEFEYEDDLETTTPSAPSVVGESSEGPPPLPPVDNQLPDFVFDNPIGRYVLANDPHTEGDPAAVLMQSWELLGNFVGKGVVHRINNTPIYANGYLLIVGATGVGRKGTSLSDAKGPYLAGEMEMIDYIGKRVSSSIASGEGLVAQVAETGQAAPDGRLMVILQEFSKLLSASGRDGSTLSAVVREAYDGGALSVPTRKDPLVAPNAHVSLIGHVTTEEFVAKAKSDDVENGLYNRMVYAMVKSNKILPNPGNVGDNARVELAEALLAARDWVLDSVDTAREMVWSPEARVMWEEFYIQTRKDAVDESVSPLIRQALARSTNHVIKFAMRHAILDRTEVMGVKHMKSALALWDYCKASAIDLFTQLITNEDDLGIIEQAIRDSGGSSRTDLQRVVMGASFSHVTELINSLVRTNKIELKPVSKAGRTQDLYRIKNGSSK